MSGASTVTVTDLATGATSTSTRGPTVPTGGAAVQSGPSGPPNNDLTLVVGGRRFGGWEEVVVTRGIEIMPSSFDVRLTELFPGQANLIDIQPGQSVVVMAGADVLVTGYIDRYTASIGPDSHEVRIVGRGKCQDLVDCSAGINPDGTSGGMVINQATATSIAQRLAAPFGIDVVVTADENHNPIGAFQLIFGETPYEVLDRVATYRGLLVYEDAQGRLVLGKVGEETHATGFAAPSNILSANATLSADQRHSDYFVTWTSTDSLAQVAKELHVPGAAVVLRVRDTTAPVPRFRPLAFVTEQTAAIPDLAAIRAAWEMNRRNGRSQAVTLTCNNWRDGSGRLWEPNMLAPLDIPACKITRQTWLISQVTFRKGEYGTEADLVLMPPRRVPAAAGRVAGGEPSSPGRNHRGSRADAMMRVGFCGP